MTLHGITRDQIYALNILDDIAVFVARAEMASVGSLVLARDALKEDSVTRICEDPEHALLDAMIEYLAVMAETK